MWNYNDRPVHTAHHTETTNLTWKLPGTSLGVIFFSSFFAVVVTILCVVTKVLECSSAMWVSSFVFNQFFGWNILPISCKGQTLSHSQCFHLYGLFFFLTTSHVAKYSNFSSCFHHRLYQSNHGFWVLLYLLFCERFFLLLRLSLKAVIM